MGIGPKRGTTMKTADETGEAPDAMRVGITHFDVMTAQAQCGDGFTR